jgi:hypothetical protein
VHVALPDPADLAHLLDHTAPVCASIYLPTRPDTPDGEAERIGWKNLTTEALRQMEAGGAGTATLDAFAELFAGVDADERFWRYQARTLAVFTDGTRLRAFHLPNRLAEHVEVADRYHAKPLLRAVSFPAACFVLGLSQGSVRVLEVGADYGPFDVAVEGMPADASAFLRPADGPQRSPVRRHTGAEGQKVRLEQFARAVDGALREALRGHDLPVVLAAAEPLAGIFRSVATVAPLVEEGVPGNPDRTPTAELAEAARPVLDRWHAARLAALHERFEREAGRGRTATDLADLARAATHGAVEVLLADVDRTVTGTVDTDGRIEPGPAGPGTYDIVDEIARRTLATGGRVLAVRAGDVPGGGPTAAILRWV